MKVSIYFVSSLIFHSVYPPFHGEAICFNFINYICSWRSRQVFESFFMRVEGEGRKKEIPPYQYPSMSIVNKSGYVINKRKTKLYSSKGNTDSFVELGDVWRTRKTYEGHTGFLNCYSKIYQLDWFVHMWNLYCCFRKMNRYCNVVIWHVVTSFRLENAWS